VLPHGVEDCGVGRIRKLLWEVQIKKINKKETNYTPLYYYII
jgi:hypothetical protein